MRSGDKYYGHIYGRKRLIVRDLIFVSDAIVLLVSPFFASLFRFDAFYVPESLYLPSVIVSAVYFAFMILMRSYTRIDLSFLRVGVVRLTMSLVSAYALFFSLSYFMKSSGDISRLWMGYNFITSILLLASCRLVFGYVLHKTGVAMRLRPAFSIIYSGSHRNVMNAIVTAKDTYRINVDKCIELPSLDDFKDNGKKVEAELALLRRSVPDVLILALSDDDRRRFSTFLPAISAIPSEILEFSFLTADVLLPEREKINMNSGQPREWVVVAGLPFIRSAEQPLSGRGWWIKRLEDIILGIFLMILFSPVMIFAAIGVKLTTPGPVLYRQLRHGFNGQEIKIFKFRSMYAECCDPEAVGELSQVRKGDPRVTRFGLFLRRTSLDELPQLFNVLRGEMSLVGPRPHATNQYAHYQGKVNTYFSRHRVRPGITGWAQINGWRGETDTDEKIQQRIACDLYYISHWSIWFDIRILFLTLFLGFANKNAF
ncbi:MULTISPECIES: exopolysaccharide biosynthesis polyprenyl glycosylphosphotransferase [Thalassospira]|nr:MULTISPECIES: exopolysaccharide biosynthesis polyprenyl glycosylphosphotransferase [Thalassospira]MCH2276697.1 exopolysaccharide biosynthesis polyprenyl glycosylphosphotransferase [Thalassospira sp.]